MDAGRVRNVGVRRVAPDWGGTQAGLLEPKGLSKQGPGYDHVRAGWRDAQSRSRFRTIGSDGRVCARAFECAEVARGSAESPLAIGGFVQKVFPARQAEHGRAGGADANAVGRERVILRRRVAEAGRGRPH